MSDCRNQFLQSVEQILVHFVQDPVTVNAMADKITIALNDYELMERCTEIVPLDSLNEKLIKRYCACLSVDGKSNKTIHQYRRSATLLSDFVGKPFTEMGTYDIRFYLAMQKERGISERSLENIRANLSAFFQWLTIEEVIEKNPMLKMPCSGEQSRKISILMRACRNDRLFFYAIMQTTPIVMTEVAAKG